MNTSNQQESATSAPGNMPRDMLIWDGQCKFCEACIGWVQRRDRGRIFETLPYQDVPSPPMNEQLLGQCREAVQVFTATGEQYSAGMACVYVLKRLGYRRLGSMMQSRALSPLVEWIYRRVANNRGLVARILKTT